MKKLLALAALVLGLASCQTEPEGLDVNVGGEVDTVVAVSLPETETRANSALGAFDNVDLNGTNGTDYTVRYIFEVYYGNTGTQKQVYYTDGKNASFPVRLVPGRHYNFVAWADIVEQPTDDKMNKALPYEDENTDVYYDTSDLTNITIIDNEWVAMDEKRDAFTGHFDTAEDGDKKPYNGTKSINFTLTRPFAKLRILTTDMQQLKDLGIRPTTAVVTYKDASHHASFNACNGSYGDRTNTKTHEYTVSIDDVHYTSMYGEKYSDETYTLFTDYFFATKEQEVINFSLDVRDQGDNPIGETKNFSTSIPAQRNYLTTISGNILTDGNNIKVDVTDSFNNALQPNNPPYYVEIWDGESQTEPEVIVNETGATVAVVYTPSELAWLAGYVNGTNSFSTASVAATRATTKINFVLGADIDLGGNEWTPIGNKAHHFDGTFDGNGHTIKGLSVTKIHDNGEQAALFGTMSGHPVIKNFVIDDAYIKYPNDGEDFYASAVAGTIYGYVTFENITVKNSTITGNNKVGAIFAHDGSSNKITINNCHVDKCYIASEDLKDGGNVGGLIGLYQTGSTEVCKISNSSVKNSTIVGINSSNTGKRANSEFIGGIMTKATTNLVLENCVVENNNFSQTINGTDAVTYVGAFPAQFIGGDREEKLLGFVVVNGVPVCPADYETLANYPNIFVKEGNYYVFGIAGLNDLNNYFKANWCGNNTWTPEYNIAADIDATGFTWDGVYLNVGWNGNNGIVLNGNGHTISNLTINNYLLSGTPCGGSDGVKPGLVKDITMKNVTVNGSSHDAAIFWGNCFTNVNFENVTVDGAKIKGGSNVGALVSRTSIEGPNTEIMINFKNCVVKNSTLEADNTNADPNGASGFIGRTYGNTKLTFEGCSVENNTINNANGLVGGAVYGYTTWYGDGFYGTGACDTFTNWNGLVIETVTTEEALSKALKAGKNVILGADIAMTKSITISNANFTLDGNGKTITMAENATNEYALFDSVTGKLTLKNIVFDGIKGGAVLRTIGAELTLDNITVKNCEHTKPIYGLFRLIGKNTIKNSKFENNKCITVITFNTEGDDNTDPQLVQNCEFKNNTCSATAVVHYSTGGGATIDGNKFVNNTLNVSNGATVYLGFKKNCTVTNNLFDGNTVTATSKRSAGGLMVGNAAVVTGNAFVNNTVTVNGETGYGNDVCASPYYAAIDLSGNYWGGGAPVENDDYYKEYNNYDVIINDYLTVNPFN